MSKAGVGARDCGLPMNGWDGWLTSGEPGCQFEPVIEGECELPPWIPYIL